MEAKLKENNLNRWQVENFHRIYKSKFEANRQARRVMNDQQYLQYRGLRPSCRVTVPLLSIQNIRDAAIGFRRLAKELDAIQRQSGLELEQRCHLAPSQTTSCSQWLKHQACRGEEVDPSGTFNNSK